MTAGWHVVCRNKEPEVDGSSLPTCELRTASESYGPPATGESGSITRMRGDAGGDPGPRRGPGWATRYPPLLSLAIALTIAVTVLPSSLHLPLSHPKQTREIAPVVAGDQSEPSPPGDLGSLALAGTSRHASPSTPEYEAAPDSPPPLPVVGKTPTTKRCVGMPPRQTEDKLSPPCVAHFEGDNFGATHHGVTREEIRILIYIEGDFVDLGTSRGTEVRPDASYWDLAEPPQSDEHAIVRALRRWQQYFNHRYQTYGRFAHFVVYFSGPDDSVEARLADAEDNYAKVHPFAVLSYQRFNADAYLERMAQLGVLNFGSYVGRPASFFQRYPGMIWGFYPSLEEQARLFTSYLCQKVAPHPVEFSANGGELGEPRNYGIWRTNNESFPGYIHFAEMVTEGAAQCGITPAAEHTFPTVGYTQDNRYVPTYASRACADFKAKNVTTILWLMGLETNFSRACAAIDYYPEVIIAGDRVIEDNGFDDDQNQAFWNQAVVVTNITAAGAVTESPCFQAYRETDPDAPQIDITYIACRYYDDLRQLFSGIQVAGPRLTPASINEGFRAIPAIRSTDPRVPACYYAPGDYTCVKDAQVMGYDSNTNNGNGAPCWRMYEGGQRYLADGWPAGNVLSQSGGAGDPCNTWSAGSGSVTNPYPPDPQNPEG